MKRVSVAEAKNHLPALIHEAEESGPVEIVRHAKPVAVIVAHDEFERMKREAGVTSSFARVLEWRKKYAKDLDALDVEGALSGTRDQRPGRRVKW